MGMDQIHGFFQYQRDNFEESDQTRLQVIYKQITDNKTKQPVPNAFVLYVQAKQRAGNKPKITLAKHKII